MKRLMLISLLSCMAVGQVSCADQKGLLGQAAGAAVSIVEACSVGCIAAGASIFFNSSPIKNAAQCVGLYAGYGVLSSLVPSFSPTRLFRDFIMIPFTHPGAGKQAMQAQAEKDDRNAEKFNAGQALGFTLSGLAAWVIFASTKK